MVEVEPKSGQPSYPIMVGTEVERHAEAFFHPRQDAYKSDVGDAGSQEIATRFVNKI